MNIQFSGQKFLRLTAAFSISVFVMISIESLARDMDRSDGTRGTLASPAESDTSSPEREAPTTERLNVDEFSVYFADDDDTRPPDRLTWVETQIGSLKEKKLSKAVLTAFLEAETLNSLSLALAYARLNTVAEYLESLGIPKGRIHSQVQYDPPGTKLCETATCRASYRRIGVQVFLSKRLRGKR